MQATKVGAIIILGTFLSVVIYFSYFDHGHIFELGDLSTLIGALLALLVIYIVVLPFIGF